MWPVQFHREAPHQIPILIKAVLIIYHSWYLVDKWGRRPILLSGAVVMVLALSSISGLMYINTPQTPALVVVSVVVYNAFFGYSWGPVPWSVHSYHAYYDHY